MLEQFNFYACKGDLRRLAPKYGINQNDLRDQRMIEILGYYVNNPKFMVTYDDELNKFEIRDKYKRTR